MFIEALKAQNENNLALRHSLLTTQGYKAVINNPKCFNVSPSIDSYAWSEEVNQWINSMPEEDLCIYSTHREETLDDFLDCEDVTMSAEDFNTLDSAICQLFTETTKLSTF